MSRFHSVKTLQLVYNRLYNSSKHDANRLLSLDVGERYIGVATTSTDNRTCHSLNTLHRKVEYKGNNDKKRRLVPTKIEYIADTLKDLLRKNNAFGIVVGLPLDHQGNEGIQAQKNRQFISILEIYGGLDTDIYWADESCSTIEAVDQLLNNANSNINVDEQYNNIKNKKTGKWDKGRSKSKSRKKKIKFNDLKKENIDSQAATVILDKFLLDVNINS